MIKYKCPFCKTGLETDDALSGKQDTCPECGKVHHGPLAKQDLLRQENYPMLKIIQDFLNQPNKFYSLFADPHSQLLVKGWFLEDFKKFLEEQKPCKTSQETVDSFLRSKYFRVQFHYQTRQAWMGVRDRIYLDFSDYELSRRNPKTSGADEKSAYRSYYPSCD
jgi:hypothetical protein